MSVTQTKITKIDGSEKIYKVLPATIVAFEHKFGIGLSQMTTMEQLYWIAWDAESKVVKREGGVTKLYEDWLNDLEDVEDVPSDEVPTRAVSTPSTSPR